MNLPDQPKDNILSILSAPTVMQKETVEAEFVEEIEKPGLNLNDFDQFRQNKEEERIKEESQPEPEPEKEEPPIMSYHDQAGLLIAFVDGTMQLSLPYLYQRSIFNKGEIKKLKELKKSLKEKKETSLDSVELELMDKYNDYIDLKNNVEFSEKEVGYLHEPIEKTLEKYKVKLGPEIMLAGALMMVLTPRIMPLFAKLD